MPRDITDTSCTAFLSNRIIASGDVLEVVRRVKAAVDRDEFAQPIVFDDHTSQVIEFDLRGSLEQVLDRARKRVAASEPEMDTDVSAPRGPGRPKLGVVAREITLLPRHWDWLAGQPGGASVALRKLVEQAIKANRDTDAIRRAQDATYRFVTTMAGNEPGYEEAIRALFGGQAELFRKCMDRWPADIRKHAGKLAAPVFAAGGK